MRPARHCVDLGGVGDGALAIDAEQIQVHGIDAWPVRLLPAWDVTQDNLSELGMIPPRTTHVDGVMGMVHLCSHCL